MRKDEQHKPINKIALRINTFITKAEYQQLERLSVPIDQFIKQKLKRCSATRRDGKPCQGKPVKGATRCKFHGGLSTGPKSEEGKKKALANLLKSHRRQGISKK